MVEGGGCDNVGEEPLRVVLRDRESLKVETSHKEPWADGVNDFMVEK